MGYMLKILSLKDKLKDRILSHIGIDGAVRAYKDPHSKRKPIGCGLTIHPGIGCTYQCSYCYLKDMGINYSKIKASTLSGKELVYSLLLNPYFVPTVYGTFLAFGSITEPLHPVVRNKTLEFIREVSAFLKNPIQLSTKSYIDYELALKIKSACNGLISPLITIVTLRHYKLLEPYAPQPKLRFESIYNLKRAGLSPQLFIRPIIPGVTDDEVVNIVKQAIEYGICSVVIGGFRASKDILNRLERLGLELSIVGRIAGGDRVFYNVRTKDVRERLVSELNKVAVCHITACCANAYIHKVPCWGLDWIRGTCTSCPLTCWERLPKVAIDDVIEVLEYFGVKTRGSIKITISNKQVTIRSKEPIRNSIVVVLETLARRRVRVLKYNL